MNTLSFEFAGVELIAHGSGALFWPASELLVVSDMHLGKSDRIARRSGQLLPPYETQDTLERLHKVVHHFAPKTVICLGDSFDDIDASASLDDFVIDRITQLQAGRQWVWIEGNHDPGPLNLGGTHKTKFALHPLTFQHIASQNGTNEVSGHYHPKVSLQVKGRTISRPAFLVDNRRLILPAFGTFTGGLSASKPPLSNLMSEDSTAILTGQKPHQIPLTARLTA